MTSARESLGIDTRVQHIGYKMNFTLHFTLFARSHRLKSVRSSLDEQKKVLAKFSYEDEEVMNVHYFGQMPEQIYAELQEHDERFADFKQCRMLSEFISHLPESKLFWQRRLQMLRQAADPTKTTGHF